jgi:hypothetical protein
MNVNNHTHLLCHPGNAASSYKYGNELCSCIVPLSPTLSQWSGEKNRLAGAQGRPHKDHVVARSNEIQYDAMTKSLRPVPLFQSFASVPHE